jgi:hypothetical protein
MAVVIAFFFLLWSCVVAQCSEEGNGNHTIAFFFYFGYVARQEGDGNNIVIAFFFFLQGKKVRR